MATVRIATAEDVDGCVAVLAALPTHFTPDTHDTLRAAMAEHPTWVATIDDRVIGCVVAEGRYALSAELTWMGVLPEHQGAGIGTRLVDSAFAHLEREGVVVVEVKTLDASSGYEPYIATRGFWEARGFVQIDCIDPLPGWQPGNPSAIYVAAITATR